MFPIQETHRHVLRISFKMYNGFTKAGRSSVPTWLVPLSCLRVTTQVQLSHVRKYNVPTRLTLCQLQLWAHAKYPFFLGHNCFTDHLKKRFSKQDFQLLNSTCVALFVLNFSFSIKILRNDNAEKRFSDMNLFLGWVKEILVSLVEQRNLKTFSAWIPIRRS